MPKTWYGFPAYCKDGKVVFFYQFAGKFKARYGHIGFEDVAQLDDGVVWPTAYAITTWNPEVESRVADLLKRADIALYRAKDSGRNTTQMFHNSMQRTASERLRMETDLRLALSRGEFSVHYQPQVDARGNRIVGAEALVRW